MIQSLTLSEQQVDRFRTFASRQLGLHFGEGQLGVLAETLRRRIERTGRLPEVYLADLEARDRERAREEARLVAQDLTVTETYFFRNTDQFRAFRELVLPERARARAATRRLRLLSAGCASGEEAYTLAMVVRDCPELVGWDVGIQAIDVNVAMLAKASAGRYSSWSFRETPTEVQARCFRAEGRDFVLDPDLRAMVTFEERNLIEPDAAFWSPEAFDVVFCRNVLMYFPPEVARAVVERIAASLAPGGYLFIGYAETLRGLSQDFHLRHTHGAYYYQRREGAERLPRAEAPRASTDDDRPAPHDARAARPLDDAWVETIRRASERVRSLTAPPETGTIASSPETAPTAARAEGPPRARETAAAGAPPKSFMIFATDLMRQERFSEADALLTSLPHGAAPDADVLLLKAVLATHGGDLAAAESLTAQVLALDELNAGAHYLAALCREGAGDRRGAADHDQIATYLDPAFAMPRLHLGLLARRAGDHGAARRELAEALILLQRDDASRLLLFAGGFSREALTALCRAELVSCGGTP